MPPEDKLQKIPDMRACQQPRPTPCMIISSQSSNCCPHPAAIPKFCPMLSAPSHGHCKAHRTWLAAAILGFAPASLSPLSIAMGPSTMGGAGCRRPCWSLHSSARKNLAPWPSRVLCITCGTHAADHRHILQLDAFPVSTHSQWPAGTPLVTAAVLHPIWLLLGRMRGSRRLQCCCRCTITWYTTAETVPKYSQQGFT